MGSDAFFRSMAYNNAWANHRLLSACTGLNRDELEVVRTSFFPTLKQTLNHILIVDWYYVDAFEGGSLGPDAWKSEEPCDTIDHLYREQIAVDRRLIEVCKVLTPEALGTAVRMIRDDREQIDRTDRVLLHLFQHQIHHRGQAHAMLAGSSVRPPQLDEFFMTEDASLRSEDLSALGLSEDEISSGLSS